MAEENLHRIASRGGLHNFGPYTNMPVTLVLHIGQRVVSMYVVRRRLLIIPALLSKELSTSEIE